MTDKEKTLPAYALKTEAAARFSMFATVANDTTKEDVLRPGFWQVHWQELARLPFARVTVVREDGTMYLELLCVEAKAGLAKMRVIFEHVDNSNLPRLAEAKDMEKNRGDALQQMQEQMPEGYKISHVTAGKDRGFWVTHKQSGQKLNSKAFTDFAVAKRFADDHKAEANALPA